MKNVAEIAREINSHNLSTQELKGLVGSIQSMIAGKAKASLYVGQEVYVVQKTKRTLGVVEKINSTRCLVRMPQGKYQVPMTMLEAA
tara:strand:+ start:661 stop:921 length:261 start_codon:yes stop_codon:yes gene_type:complete